MSATAFRLLEIDSEDIEIHKLNDDQKKAINAARIQIKNGQTLTDDQSNKDIDEWLNK